MLFCIVPCHACVRACTIRWAAGQPQQQTPAPPMLHSAVPSHRDSYGAIPSPTLPGVRFEPPAQAAGMVRTLSGTLLNTKLLRLCLCCGSNWSTESECCAGWICGCRYGVGMESLRIAVPISSAVRQQRRRRDGHDAPARRRRRRSGQRWDTAGRMGGRGRASESRWRRG